MSKIIAHSLPFFPEQVVFLPPLNAHCMQSFLSILPHHIYCIQEWSFQKIYEGTGPCCQASPEGHRTLLSEESVRNAHAPSIWGNGSMSFLTLCGKPGKPPPGISKAFLTFWHLSRTIRLLVKFVQFSIPRPEPDSGRAREGQEGDCGWGPISPTRSAFSLFRVC